MSIKVDERPQEMVIKTIYFAVIYKKKVLSTILKCHSFALNVWHIGDILCCTTWSEHFRAINDAYTSSAVFMLHLAEQTANQWL